MNDNKEIKDNKVDFKDKFDKVTDIIRLYFDNEEYKIINILESINNVQHFRKHFYRYLEKEKYSKLLKFIFSRKDNNNFRLKKKIKNLDFDKILTHIGKLYLSISGEVDILLMRKIKKFYNHILDIISLVVFEWIKIMRDKEDIIYDEDNKIKTRMKDLNLFIKLFRKNVEFLFSKNKLKEYLVNTINIFSSKLNNKLPLIKVEFLPDYAKPYEYVKRYLDNILENMDSLVNDIVNLTNLYLQLLTFCSFL